MVRVKSGAIKARKAIPADVRDEYAKLYGKRWEELFHAPPDCTPQRAKVLRAEWEAEIENRIDILRAKQRGEGHDLTRSQAAALAGGWYRWFVAQHAENPGTAEDWDIARLLVQEEIAEATREWDIDPVRMQGEDRTEHPDAKAAYRPMIADIGKIAQFLASRGETLTPEARDLFLDAMLRQYWEATHTLERRAAFDYSPDKHLQTLPAYSRPNTSNSPSASKGSKSETDQTFAGLFKAYVHAKKPAASTVERWRVVFPALDAYLTANSWGIADFGPDEAQRWATSLVGSGSPPRGAYTVKNTWVGAASIVLGWAVKHKLLKSNPVAEVIIDVPRKKQTREDGKAFSEAEQQTILKAALAITDTRSPVKAACRWVPWICAYSGARAGEITQLRGQDIEQRDGFAVMKLTPEAGTIKGLIARTVPIHDHVIDQGFVEYVQAKGKGPLFYSPEATTKQESDDEDPLRPKRPRAVQTRNKLAEWVRKLGITDKEIQPNHAWRHTFKQEARRARIEKGVRDAICGHAPETEGDKYEKPTVKDMASALKQFPRYKVD
jgi:integrase